MKSSGLLAKVSKCVVAELFSIVKGKDSRNFEARNDVLSHEASDILFSDCG